jgi:hypothetical protein
MHVILLALGIAAIGAGGAMLGFGIPINQFGLGNTLIMAGTTAIAGGLIVVALAVAVRQLTRIAATLDALDLGSAPASAPEAQPRSGWVDPIPVAMVPVPTAPAPAASTSGQEPSEYAREPDPPPREAPPRELLPREPLQLPQPRIAARGRSAESGSAGNPGNSGGEPGAPMRLARSSRGEIPLVLSPRERSFDRPSEPAAAERRDVARPVERPRGQPAVLKSGVIDGMAYTIYSDGSIEAELPQGTMRFTTFDELRVYLADAS